MNRRRVIGATVVALLSMQIPAATAQGGKVPRIGLLLFNSPRSEPIGPLLQNLEAIGYVVGKTIAVEYRFADGKPERLAALAAELVQLKPDVIFALGGDVAPFAKDATTSIPIVVWTSNDPVESGLVASISRPGGNVTGVTLVYDELAGKTRFATSRPCSRTAALERKLDRLLLGREQTDRRTSQKDPHQPVNRLRTSHAATAPATRNTNPSALRAFDAGVNREVMEVAGTRVLHLAWKGLQRGMPPIGHRPHLE
jgi:ABC transporter substrate binding protein